ncbi:MAG TPA: hypothetical protein VF510_19550 [Ktedonobacterales bacterium]
MRHQGYLHRRAQRSGIQSLPVAICLGLMATALLVLAACGASSPTGVTWTPPPTRPVPTTQGTRQPTAGESTPPGSTPPAQVSYAYLYSRIDYPLQVKVDAGDTVTLTLSPHSSILTVGAAPGSGTTTVGAPISLPTDLQDYNDIGASADTVSNGNSPIAWQLISAPRQSLLNNQAITPRAYLDSVTFRWQVQAVAAGENTVEILLRIYYVYLDGSEHDGSVQVSQAAIPMVAVAASPLNALLASFKLPLAGLSWLAGIIAIIRFFYGVFKAVSDVTEPVKDAAHVARAVHGRLNRNPYDHQQGPRR